MMVLMLVLLMLFLQTFCNTLCSSVLCCCVSLLRWLARCALLSGARVEKRNGKSSGYQAGTAVIEVCFQASVESQFFRSQATINGLSNSNAGGVSNTLGNHVSEWDNGLIEVFESRPQQGLAQSADPTAGSVTMYESERVPHESTRAMKG